VSLSLNETHKLVKDAARGGGLSWGEADELARASVWLESAGVASLDEARTAIAGNHDDLRTAIAARDTILVQLLHRTADHPVTCRQTSLGRLAFALMMTIDVPEDCAVRVEATTTQDAPAWTLQRSGTSVTASHRPENLSDSKFDVVATVHLETIEPLSIDLWSPAIQQHAFETGLSPDRKALAALRILARKTLVPATEQSRLKGAGAGTVDRD